MKKKILVLTSTFPRFKGDNCPPFVYELSKRLTKNYQIYLLSPYSPGAKEFEIMDNIRVYRFKFWPSLGKRLVTEDAIGPSLRKNSLLYIQAFFYTLFQFINIFRIRRKEKITTIHAHWILSQGFNAVLYKKLMDPQVKVIITSHGGDVYSMKNINFVKRWIVNNCDALTVVSRSVKKEISKLKVRKKLNMQIIPMGVDSTLFNPDKYDKSLKQKLNPDGPILLSVGRLEDKKGVEYLIKAVPLVIKDRPNVKLIIIGSGTLENMLKKITNRLRLNKNIIFIGPVPNSELPKYYATADIFIGPSINTEGGDTEGLGLTFVEASFSGCVPIGTDVGGISDVIQDGKTGMIVKEKDPKAISRAILRLLSNKSLKNKISVAARTKNLQKFEWDVVYKKFEKIL